MRMKQLSIVQRQARSVLFQMGIRKPVSIVASSYVHGATTPCEALGILAKLPTFV